MKFFRSDESTNKIHELMTTMGFNQDENGKYWHMYFGSEVKFDLSASSSENHAVMAHVFKVAVEWGKQDKLDDVRKVLGL